MILANAPRTSNFTERPSSITLGGCLANTSLGLEVVTAVSRHPVELWLLITPLVAISAAYALYTREHSKRQQLQYLYQSSDLLQRATADSSAIPELLAQPGVFGATSWANACRDRTDLPRHLLEAIEAVLS